MQENFLDLVAGAIEQSEEFTTEEPPASKAEISLDDSYIGGLGDVCADVQDKATEKEKREAGYVPCIDVRSRLFQETTGGIVQSLRQAAHPRGPPEQRQEHGAALEIPLAREQWW